MRKFLLSSFLVIFLVSNAHGAISEDMSVYVRQDVLNERDRAFMAEIRLGFEQMRREMDKRFSEVDKRFDALDKKIDNVKTELHQEIQSVKTELHEEIQSVTLELHEEIQAVSTRVAKLETRIESMDKSLDRSISVLTLIVTFVGVIVGFAIFAPALLEFVKGLRKAQVMPEDSERLLERIEALERAMNLQLRVK